MKYKKGKYPVMANWLLTKRVGDEYRVKNVLIEKEFLMNRSAFMILKSLDGKTNPYEIVGYTPTEIDETVEYLKKHLLVRTRNEKLVGKNGLEIKTLYIPRKRRNKSKILGGFNMLFMLGCIPSFLLGMKNLAGNMENISQNISLVLIMVLLMVSLMFHECAHVVSCLCYGGTFFEAGILKKSFYIAGTYVLIDCSNAKPRERMQVALAGVEANILLAGVLLYIASKGGELSGEFFVAAIQNTLLAICNLSIKDGFDGCTVLGEILRNKKQ